MFQHSVCQIIFELIGEGSCTCYVCENKQETLFGSVTICKYMWFVSIMIQRKYNFVINSAFGNETRKKTETFCTQKYVCVNEPWIYKL